MHTKGEWSYYIAKDDLSAQIYTTKFSNPIAVVNSYSYGNGPSRAERNANARLLSSAPELLEALQKIEQQLDYGQIDMALSIARAAIQSATRTA